MAEVAPGRSTRTTRPRWARIVTLIALFGALGVATPAGAQQRPDGGPVDVERFSARAAAWSAANVVHQQAAVERAMELGEEAAAAEEAERQAALEAAARAATSTTTAPPTTTAAPTTTLPPSTTTAAPDSAAPDSSGPDEASSDAEPADTTSTTTTAAPTGPTADQWAALRQCESGGRYDALSPGGRYRGAYQFSQATWDWVASWANPALVGVDPAAASVGDQDAQAQALYDRQGASPWPHCGRYLP